MKDYLISMFIDNELDLDEKIDFVETVYGEQKFKDETIDLLEQEKLLTGKMVHRMPQMSIPIKRTPEGGFFITWLRPFALFSAGLALGAAVLFIRPPSKPVNVPPTLANREVPYRFVIYRPNTDQAQIIGSFTRWQPVDMQKIGSSGYIQRPPRRSHTSRWSGRLYR